MVVLNLRLEETLVLMLAQTEVRSARQLFSFVSVALVVGLAWAACFNHANYGGARACEATPGL